MSGYLRLFSAESDGGLYLGFYREAWLCAHGTEEGFGDHYLASAAARSLEFPPAVAILYEDGRPAGIVELNIHRSEVRGCGYISLICVEREFRRRGLGSLLCGYAAAVYRALARDRLQRSVAEENSGAIAFYRSLGFVETSREYGSLGILYIMEKEL